MLVGHLSPIAKLAQGGIEDPRSQGLDEAGVLRHRDELVGRDEPEGGVLPSDQGFDALGSAVAEVCLGLVVQNELASGNSHPELAEHRQPGRRIEVEVVVVDDHVGLRVFGQVHGNVGAL